MTIQKTMTDFSKIEPYEDKDVPAAIARVVGHPMFPRLVKTLNPKIDVPTIKLMLSSIKTVLDFQRFFMGPLFSHIAHSTMTEFTTSGLENLDRGKHYLMVSNHRDIMLDAAMVAVDMLAKGFDTPEVGFGNNLIHNDFVKDCFALNKMFVILRGGTRREFYENSLRHSQYIRYARLEKNHSVWIAQRNGRAKNGIDHTDPALLKMFAMSGSGDFVKDMAELNILPVSVSYEYEPCDAQKILETYISATEVYEKSRNEDMNSIMTGIMQPKGHVHFTYNEPITVEELEACAQYDKNERFDKLAEVMDRRIWKGYKLHKTNYMAHDLLNSCDQYEDCYTTEQLEEFIDYVRMRTDRWPSEGAREALRDLMLKLYANPVDSANF